MGIKSSKLYQTLSLIYRYPEVLKFKKKLDKFKGGIILVGTPLHKNLGDHLIAEAEKEFLKDCYPGKELLEIPTEVFLRNREFIMTHTYPNNKVFITGGGWMGDMWPEDEKIIQDMMFIFSLCPIVILPQTIFYAKGSKLLQSANRISDLCIDLTIYAREVQSYKAALDTLSAKIRLAPDMGLYYKPDTSSVPKKHQVGVYLRKDREKVKNDELVSKTLEIFDGYGKMISDTMYPKLVPARKRKLLIDAEIKKMAECEVVITDRLHGMIFATLAGTKCIALNNRTGKVAGVYNKWLNKSGNVLLLERFDEDLIRYFINDPRKCDISYLAPEFEMMKDALAHI